MRSSPRICTLVLFIVLVCQTENVVCCVAGGDGGNGGEQVPDGRTAYLCVRALSRGVGQTGQLGRHPPGLLQERPLGHTGPSSLVSWSTVCVSGVMGFD